MAINNATILVTGATGCVGSNLVRRLLRDHTRIAVLVRPGDSLGTLSADRHRLDIKMGDVRSFDDCLRAMVSIEQVYHAAGIAIPLNKLERAMWEVNVMGTQNVLRAAKEKGVRKCVHISSISAIGYPSNQEVANETYDFNESRETNAYAITKHCSERVAMEFNTSDFTVVIVNPSAVLAPGGDRRHGWAALIELERRGLLRFLPSGGSAFCSRHDLVEGLLAAMNHGRGGERYILTTENLSYRDLALRMAALFGTHYYRFSVPRALLAAVARINSSTARWRSDQDDHGPLLVTESARLLNRTLFYSNAKAVRHLGFSPTSCDNALVELQQWCCGGEIASYPAKKETCLF
jgi:dihydroflavonol-4-reductase